ncbi:concanavalin A-like lectin/glucanase [Saitoella complicata NRRL Y-17804]|nr:concanavalin A-like lectin/glucanase [Saitoella complicata NRRL Y-17804]ODQ53337.1 concanavalin A-like lectin/glucanase [Saitoella complicata NRRL Y-17804]
MGGLFTLRDESNQTHFFSTFGTQGGREPGNGNYALFATGSMSKSSNGSAIMDTSAVGIVDNGNSYAQNSFWDTKENRRVMMAWTPEDLNNYGILAQGWQGALVLPRELFVKTITGVTNLASEVEERAAWTYEKESNGSYTVETLGQRPISGLESLRNTSVCSTIPAQAVCAVADFVDDGFGYKSLYSAVTKNYEMQLSIDFSKDPSAAAGVVLRKSQSGFCEYTSIWYDAAEEYLYVDRDQSSIYSPYITNTTIQTKFRLWEINGEREKLDLRIFVDNSILEIFANDVLALTTRIYPYLQDSNEIGLMVKNGSAQYSDVTVWDGLDNAWPERPYDTSVPLVWDGPEITDNGRLWVGN